MKSKNITIVLVCLLVAFAGYIFYKKFKQDDNTLDTSELTETKTVTDAATTAPATTTDADTTTAPATTTDADTTTAPATTGTTATAEKTSAAATPEHKDTAQAITKDDVAEIVRNEIVNNPDIVVKALKDHANNQQKLEEAKVEEAIVSNKDALLNNINDPKYGQASAKNKIVHYYDYNCSYCQKMSKVIKQLIDEKLDMYIVFKELPALGSASAQASKAALAVNKLYPKKYLDFHFALMESSSNENIDQKIKSVAKALNINEAKLYKKMDDKQIELMLQENFKLASAIGIRGVPDIIINDKFYPGAISYEQAKANIIN